MYAIIRHSELKYDVTYKYADIRHSESKYDVIYMYAITA